MQSQKNRLQGKFISYVKRIGDLLVMADLLVGGLVYRVMKYIKDINSG